MVGTKEKSRASACGVLLGSFQVSPVWVPSRSCCLGSSPRPQPGGDGSLLPIILCLLRPGCKWLPNGASCHLASGGWSTVLTTCHRQVNLKLLLKRKIWGRCKPVSSCYKAGVALFKPPPSPLTHSSQYLFVYLLCGQGEVAVELLQEFPQREGLELFLGS